MKPTCNICKAHPSDCKCTSEQVWDNACAPEGLREKLSQAIEDIIQTPSEMYGIDEKDKILKILEKTLKK